MSRCSSRIFWLLIALAVSSLLPVTSVSAAPALPEAYDYLNSTASVTVVRKSCGFLCSYTVFTPTATAPVRGVILYPGAFIPSAAYAPLAYRLAERGFRVGMPNFLFNFALIAPRRAEKIIAAYPGIQHWTVGGHSLGGVAATKFVDNNPAAAEVSGVFYLASYPDEVNNLADQNLAVLSIYGSEDTVLKRDRLDAARDNLPVATTYQVIPGGNHAQMGYYGPQKGDGVATLSREAQQAIVLDAITTLGTATP
jgi:dienelactone hydrolase